MKSIVSKEMESVSGGIGREAMHCHRRLGVGDRGLLEQANNQR